MRYIENTELREWIKESLRKSIFQKAHALAVQTGCDILVKLEDSEDNVIGSQYYATSTLDNVFSSKGLRKKPQDVTVSGDTGLPVSPLVDRGIQSSSEEPSASSRNNNSSGSSSSVEDIAQRLSSRITANGASSSSGGAVPMQLTVAEDVATKINSQGSDSSSPAPATQDSATQDEVMKDVSTEEDITVKIEPVTDDEPPDPGVDSNRDIEDAQAGHLPSASSQMSFSLQPGNQSVVEASLPPSSTSPSGQVTIGGMTRDSKLYPVPISPKPYQCALCHKAFRSVQVLQKHTQTFHMRPQNVMSRRGRGRGRGGFARSLHQLTSHSPPPRHLCLACNRVFHSAHQLEDHMARFHLNPDPPPVSQPQPTSFEDSLALAEAAHLAGDIPFPSLDDDVNPAGNNSQNLEDIPGPSTSMDESVSQMQPGAADPPFVQPPTSASALFVPPVFGGFGSPSVPSSRSPASSSAHRGGTPRRGRKSLSPMKKTNHASPKSFSSAKKRRSNHASRLHGVHVQNATTMIEVNKALVRQPSGVLTLSNGVKQTLAPLADNPNKVARALASKLFTVEERVNGNCAGKRGQNQLDVERLELMKMTIYDVCDIEDAEQDEAWRAIRTSVDSSNRALRFIYNHSKT